jgi:hypothetical protein
LRGKSKEDRVKEMSVNELDMFFSYGLALPVSSPLDDPPAFGLKARANDDPDWTPAFAGRAIVTSPYQVADFHALTSF